jgi:hypothetical protein
MVGVRPVMQCSRINPNLLSTGFDLYDAGAILETMKATGADEGNVLPFHDDAELLAGFEAEINVRSVNVEEESDDDDTHLGGQSQAAMKLLDEADPIDEDDEKGVPTDGIGRREVKPTVCVSEQFAASPAAAVSQFAALLGQSTESMRSLEASRTPPVGHDQPMTVSSNDDTHQLFRKPTVASKLYATTPSAAAIGSVTGTVMPDVTESGSASRKHYTEPTAKTTRVQSNTPIKSRPDDTDDSKRSKASNMTLVGTTTAAIRHGEIGPTAFSRRDLPLPGKK